MKKNKHGEWNPGDLILFEDTGEWCVLQEKFDIYNTSRTRNLEERGYHSESWAWRVDWGRSEGVWSRMDVGMCHGAADAIGIWVSSYGNHMGFTTIFLYHLL